MTQSSFQIAQRHHQAGRLADAQAIYRQILLERPDDPDALHMLGVSEFQLGRHEEALVSLRPAAQISTAIWDYSLEIWAKPKRRSKHCGRP
jgi:Flp pilus assembly protein TadD